MKNVIVSAMNDLIDRFSHMGIHIPEILLPSNVDMNKWAVVACDQFTSQKDYWVKTTKIVDKGPSTLKLILPEVYLEDNDRKERISDIKNTMRSYIDNNILKTLEPGFVLVDRSTPFTNSRKGLILAIDLEQYCFQGSEKCLIRPTEGTVIDRLPPRIEIRENAPLDIPHILLLINDESGDIIENSFNHIDEFETIYDFNLMQNGGEIKGHLISKPEHLERICLAFEKLFKRHEMLFAVGDGNHSLASAKEIWDKLKSKGASLDHPARYALVEVNNIYNDGIIFEPIHRVLFNVDKSDFINYLIAKTDTVVKHTATKDQVKKLLRTDTTEHNVGFLSSGKWGYLTINEPETKLSYEVVQRIIDEYIKNNPKTKVDYIHGDKVVNELGMKKDTLVLYFPAIEKHRFFKMIEEDGSLPRKTFSIGEAEEKRYYIESRKIH